MGSIENRHIPEKYLYIFTIPFPSLTCIFFVTAAKRGSLSIPYVTQMEIICEPDHICTNSDSDMARSLDYRPISLSRFMKIDLQSSGLGIRIYTIRDRLVLRFQ